MEFDTRNGSMLQPTISYDDEFNKLLDQLFSVEQDAVASTDLPEAQLPVTPIFDEKVLLGIDRDKWIKTEAAVAVSHMQKFLTASPPSSDDMGSGGSSRSEHSGLRETLSTVTDEPHENNAYLSKVERSRRAQRKFREKQKGSLAALTQQLEQATQQLEQLSTDNDALRQKTKVLDAFLKLRDEHLFLLQTMHNPDGPAQPPPDSSAMKCKMSSREMAQELRQLQVMSPEAFINRWRNFLRNISSWLVRAEANESDEEAQQKIISLCGCAGWSVKNVSLLNWGTMRTVFTINLEECCPAEPPEAHWDRVVHMLVLTPEQKRDITTARDIFFSEQDKILKEREKLFAWAQQTTLQQDALYKAMDGDYDRFSASELEGLLQENLRQTHQLVTTFCEFVFSKVFTPLQFAKVAVYSYPFFPCGIMVSRALDKVKLLNGAA